MTLVRWTTGVVCVAMMASGGAALAGSIRVSDGCAIIGYVGLLTVALEWILIMVRALMDGLLHLWCRVRADLAPLRGHLLSQGQRSSSSRMPSEKRSD